MSAVAVHRSPYAGSWYPGDPTALNDLLDNLFSRSESRTGADLLPQASGFVVPHAGLAYSGGVAAAVYRHLANDPPERVIVLGFTHRGAPAGTWIPDVEAYSTPLGETHVDRQTVKELLGLGPFEMMREERLCDHSVEIQLPLLQRSCPRTAIVPIYVSSIDDDARRRAGASLARVLRPGTVVLASSDFTHFGDSFRFKPFPHNDETPERLHRLDEGFLEAVGSMDSDLLLRTLRSESATVCGREPIALLQDAIGQLANGEDHFQRTLDYETSGDVTGDYSHCVSYASCGFYPWSSFLLDEEEREMLLSSARDTLRHYRETGLSTPVLPDWETPRLSRKAGAFVTLRQDGRLRGCVGRISANEPLSDVVPEMTMAAALGDSRFEPLRIEEPGIDIEVSILSPMKLIADPARFCVARDGGYLKLGGISGLLLPQVAEDRDWDASEFLQALARKAHLTEGVYDDPSARLYVFRAQVIQ